MALFDDDEVTAMPTPPLPLAINVLELDPAECGPALKKDVDAVVDDCKNPGVVVEIVCPLGVLGKRCEPDML